MTEANPPIDRRHRVRVSVDFWNYTLHMKSVDEPFRTDWSRLGPVLSRAATEVVDPTATKGNRSSPIFPQAPPTNLRTKLRSFSIVLETPLLTALEDDQCRIPVSYPPTLNHD